jgi:hypothetical protein
MFSLPYQNEPTECNPASWLAARLDKAMRLLSDLEWSSFQRGAGRGFMDSGGDGPLVRCCPCCRGIYPDSAFRSDFRKEYWGHAKDCRLDAILHGPAAEGTER